MKLRMAVMGLGRIFARVMADLPNFENVELYAVASRDGVRAKAACEKYGAKVWYGSYEEMLADKNVDLVYVATPHTLHCQHTVMCLNAGKHVVCEKPFAVNAEEARIMAKTAREKNLFLMEAMWTRFMPAILKLKSMTDAGELGDVLHIAADFAGAAPLDPNDRIYNPALAGGALLDLGIYPLSIIEYLLGKADSIKSDIVKGFTGVDARTTVGMRWDSGATAYFMCGVDVNGTSRMTVYGTKAIVEIPDYWCAVKLEVKRNGTCDVITFPRETEGHHHQFDHAAECILNGLTESPVMPLDESIHLMQVMTDIRYEHGVKYPME